MNKTPILSLFSALFLVTVFCPLLTCCDDDYEPKVYILDEEVAAGLMADNSEVTDTTCVTATIQGKMLHEKKLKDMLNLSNFVVGIQYITEKDFNSHSNEQLYWSKRTSEESTISDFKIQLKYLEPSTNYFYRIFLSDGDFMLFGDIKQFTTHSADRYLNLEVVEQDFRSMKFAGINRLEGLMGKIPENGIRMRYYERDNVHKDVYLTRKGDSLFLSLTDVLSAGHTYKYYIEAYANGRTVCTSMKTFSTRNPADYIYLNELEISSTSAVISGQVDSLIFTNYNSDYNMHIAHNTTDVYYGTDINKLWSWAYIWTKNPKFRLELKNLQPATTYYYKVGATFHNIYNENFYTEIHSFTTN